MKLHESCNWPFYTAESNYVHLVLLLKIKKCLGECKVYRSFMDAFDFMQQQMHLQVAAPLLV